MATFDPLQSFQTAESGALDIQRQRQGLEMGKTQNALANVGLQGAQRNLQSSTRQEGISQEGQRVQFMNKAGKALLRIPVERRGEAFAKLEPFAQQVGIKQGTFTPERLSDESLQQLIQTTEGFIRDPATLEQQRLNLRERELQQRGQLLREEPFRKGAIEREKIEAQRGRKADVAGEVAGAQVRAKKIEERGQEVIQRGLSAADGTAVLRRGMQLLDGIETGGIDRVALGAKQFFGVESGDEGELSNLLGKAVLAQLRETFGAAFTAKEGDSLKAIDANIGKSPAANKRLLRNALRIAERSALRGIDRAVEAKDFKTAAEIQESLDFILEELPQGVPQEQQGPQTVTSQEEFDALPSGAMFIEDGQAFRKP